MRPTCEQSDCTSPAQIRLRLVSGEYRYGKLCSKHHKAKYSLYYKYCGRKNPRPIPKVKPRCQLPGCGLTAHNMGYGYYRRYCIKHHLVRFHSPTGRYHEPAVNDISRQPCSRCGWNESFCDRHRVVPGYKGGQYVKDNVIPLCPNCHRIETHGSFPNTHLPKVA